MQQGHLKRSHISTKVHGATYQKVFLYLFRAKGAAFYYVAPYIVAGLWRSANPASFDGRSLSRNLNRKTTERTK
jgi:hypothetical protein